MTEAASSPLRSRAAQFALLAGLFVVGMARTWGKWPDVMVDFGRELYAPWRLSEGDALYVDVAWFNGPLSPYFNALAFATFGAGLSTLVWVNAALFAVLLAVLHSVLRAFSSPWAATGACAVVVACCGFAQLVGIGNYNYICPYSHEATHGLLLALSATWAANRWAASGNSRWSALCGALVGAAFLTKPEMFLAAFAGGFGGGALHAWSARTPRRDRSLALFTACACALLPIALAYLGLALAIPAEAAWRGVVGAWPSLLESDVVGLEFYRKGMGLDAPAANAARMLAWGAGWCSAAALVAAAAFAARSARPRAIAWVAAFVALGALAIFGARELRLADFARAWPLAALATLVVAVARIARGRGTGATAGAGAFAALALALLAKMPLNARLEHYGFALAMPATALIAVGALHALPAWAARRGWSAPVARAGAVAVLAVFAATHVAQTEKIHARKKDSIGAGADRFTADARARVLGATLEWLERAKLSASPPDTLAVFPEGVMLNYLARIPSSTPYVNFMPPELMLFGEERIEQAFRAAPPDVVVLTHKSTAEYGYAWFGVDYAAGLGAWLRAEYEVVEIIGDPPLQSQSRFGAAVLRRKR